MSARALVALLLVSLALAAWVVVSQPKTQPKYEKIPGVGPRPTCACERRNLKIDPLIYDKVYVKEHYGTEAEVLIAGKGKSAVKLARLLAEKYGGKVVKVWEPINSAMVVVPTRALVAFAEEAAKAPSVLGVVLNKELSILTLDTIQYLGVEYIWEAPDLGYDGSGVKLAVLDTGIDISHPDMPIPAAWYDFINGEPEPYDDHGHGTHVSGTIAAQGNVNWAHSGERAWHAYNYNYHLEFGYPENTWITYQIDVSAYAGSQVVISYATFYIIEEGWDCLLYTSPSPRDRG